MLDATKERPTQTKNDGVRCPEPSVSFPGVLSLGPITYLCADLGLHETRGRRRTQSPLPRRKEGRVPGWVVGCTADAENGPSCQVADALEYKIQCHSECECVCVREREILV